jgi:hypothetical protein
MILIKIYNIYCSFSWHETYTWFFSVLVPVPVAGFSIACAFIHVQVVKWLIDRVSHENLHHACIHDTFQLAIWQHLSQSILLGQQPSAVLSFHWTLYFSNLTSRRPRAASLPATYKYMHAPSQTSQAARLVPQERKFFWRIHVRVTRQSSTMFRSA